MGAKKQFSYLSVLTLVWILGIALMVEVTYKCVSVSLRDISWAPYLKDIANVYISIPDMESVKA